MNHESAFLKAILAEPESDAPRLLYADWLEERGDMRGEFIRVQCALEKIPRHEPRPTRAETLMCPCLWCRLKCRARVLCHDGYPEPGWVWAGAPLNQIPDAEYTFRRGFVDDVKMRAEHWLAHADALTAAAPISEVGLTTWPAFRVVGMDEWNRLAQKHNVLWSGLVQEWPDYVRRLLAAEWPRITFTMPSSGPMRDGGAWTADAPV